MKWGLGGKKACKTSALHQLHSLPPQHKVAGRPDVGSGMVKAVT